jgi:hypothetical protein
MMILIGFLFSIVTAGIFPDVFRRHGSFTSSPLPLLTNFEQRAISWPWGLLTCAVLIAVAFRARLKNGTWIAMLISGVLLGQFLIQIWH